MFSRLTRRQPPVVHESPAASRQRGGIPGAHLVVAGVTLGAVAAFVLTTMLSSAPARAETRTPRNVSGPRG